MVALTNAAPIGVRQILIAQFFDLVQFASIQQPWSEIYTRAFLPFAAPEGSLVGRGAAQAARASAQGLSAYIGAYGNAYHEPLQVVQESGGLMLVLGATPPAVAARALER
jgi:hypothetical protein